ncbi:ricin-type beta-trefoil lectin domain protein [Kitasatospora sp. CM 4170]|uniref:Ricin-type beta-trefoil lectin domain protein n=1 Tax=Kitasatospora aburaviensis TaxID=67265 RepID=A0ABW1F2S7_9ACTN|nr:ricin-type beta-trefoil lectin domain protein [Kitasatospora sp. CM 4170]WNM47626.1 ricin-type beta-trefoil lectin domain protein [Kitasatospora sp. CM 4170]
MEGTAARLARGARALLAHGTVAVLLLGCTAEATPAPARSTAAAGADDPVDSGSGRLCSTPEVRFPKRLVDGGTKVIETNPWNSSGTLCLDTQGTGFTVTELRDFVPKAPLAPGGYPNISTAPGASGLPVPVSALGDATSDWDATAQATGSYNVSYDLWYGPNPDNCAPGESAEVMIWLDSTDSVKPAGSKVTDAQTLGDATYDVFQAPITGPHSVISYVRTANTHSAHGLNLRLFTADALIRGYVPPGSYLCRVQAGFEIWSGGTGLKSWAFAFHNRVGLPAGEVPAGAPGICLRHGGGGLAGTPVTVGSCGDQAVSTGWTVGNDGSLRGGAACLAPAEDGRTVALARCTGGAPQRWAAGPGQSLLHMESGQCLSTVGGVLADGTAVTLKPCAGAVGQKWKLPYNGLA